MSQSIHEYLLHCWKHYKSDIGLPEKYTYIFGNPVKVHVPLDVATDGLMIVGAYPTAHFNTVKGINDVPVSDHLFPFSNDTYFDGSRVRHVKSGEELEEFFLKKLDYTRSKCWITDLVKVFLFKKGHINKYNQLGFNETTSNREDFLNLAKASLPYLYNEVELAKPKVILLLGEEVTSIVMNVSIKDANRLLQSGLQSINIRGKEYEIVASPHPGILMRGGIIGKKWRDISNCQLNILRENL